MKRRLLVNAGKKKKKAVKEPVRDPYYDEELEPVEVERIPDNQMKLTDAELDEEITKTLTSLDPNKPPKRTYFNFKQGLFQSVPNTEHMAIHIKHEGVLWSRQEKEALEKLQQEEDNEAKEKENDGAEDADQADNVDEDGKEVDPEMGSGAAVAEEKEEEKEENEEEKEDETDDGNNKKKKKKEILVKNQFNFSDRASQTFNEPMRDMQVQTEPAPKSVFSENATPSAIRDEYLKQLLKQKQQQLEEENKKKKSGFGAAATSTTTTSGLGLPPSNSKSKRNQDETGNILQSKAMLKALKIMERVTVMNASSSSYHMFRYYSDSDYKRGSFVSHLWRFKYIECSNKMVTCIEWNKRHLDMFAAGYGSYNFNQQTDGMICIYSLKSTAFPEKIISCDSGVMCMSFHPKHASLICVGSYDGSVAVYDIRNRDDAPIYSCKNPEMYHTDPVTDIQWYFDELQHDLVFYSISSDSEIKIWRMAQNELGHETFVKLRTPAVAVEPAAQLDNVYTDANGNIQVNTQTTDGSNTQRNNKAENDTKELEDGDDMTGAAGDLPALCSCVDYNPQMKHLYLVGTEDGHILECNKTCNEGYTKVYSRAHFMNVYAVKWNLFYTKIFLSCSQDWTIKLWELESDNSNNDGGENGAEQTNARNYDTLAAMQVDEPIITYNLACSVNDIAWAPFSSTVFCAVTNDGKVHVFDLAQNKNSPLCSQQITKKSKNIGLTKVSFPVGFPIIMVGDEKGNVYALKLSPNLYLNKLKHKDILKNVCPTMFDDEVFQEKEKEKLINVLKVTGNRVFDVIQHLSPKPKKMLRSPRK